MSKIQEARENFNQDYIVFSTFSFKYDGFVDDANTPKELYFHNTLDVVNTDFSLDLNIEADNVINGGQEVKFQYLPFQYQEPKNDKNPITIAGLKFDNVSNLFYEFIMDSIELSSDIVLTHRYYATDGKNAIDEPLIFNFDSPEIQLRTVTAELQHRLDMTKPFPRTTKNIKDYRWLAQ